MSFRSMGPLILLGLSPLLLLRPVCACAAETSSLAPAPATANAGLINGALRNLSSAFDAWDLGGQFRFRFEDKDYFAVPNESAADFMPKGDSSNVYYLLRERVHLGYTPCAWFQGYGEMQDASALEDDRNPSPDQDHVELRQGWVFLGNSAQFPLTLKLGRQELTYGNQRLVGAADWLNIGRTFDAAKLRYEASGCWVDAFVGQPVVTDKHEFDASDPHDRLSGAYASTATWVPFQETQLYFLARNTTAHPANDTKDKLQPLPSPRDIYTIGFRAKSLPAALKGWDYDAEVAGQFGRYKATDTSPSLDQEAFAAHAAAGYTWSTSWSPRLGLEYNFASGDCNSKDGKHGTFDNLYPSNHGLYGMMDFFSLQNLHDAHLTASCKPLKKLLVKMDGHAFWVADTHDFLYAGNGSPRATGGYGINPSAGNYVGSELDVTATYSVARFASTQAGYGHFFSGEYLHSSLSGKGGAKDANYLYAQLTLNF